MSETIYVINNGVPGAAAVTVENGPVAGPTGPKGDPGATGPRGLSILSGTGVPSSGQGSNGEYYIDTATSKLYGPKTSGNWGAGKSLVGPQGPQGIQGEPGPTGGQGPAGTVASIPYGGSGSSSSVARADHNHTDKEAVHVSTATMVGGARPVGAPLVRQQGTWVGTVTNDTGGAAVSFPVAFPNGVISAVAQPGDNTASIGYIVIDVTYTSTNTLVCICVTRSGGYVANGSTVRINYDAIGW